MVVITLGGREIPVRERSVPTGVEFEFPLEVPETGERVTVIAKVRLASDGTKTTVHVKNAPDCRRHRWPDQSLCMWFDPDGPDRTWVVSDGLDQLAAHVARHLFQEAVCRAGEPWPGEESPGKHPRPRSCTTCGGEGP